MNDSNIKQSAIVNKNIRNYPGGYVNNIIQGTEIYGDGLDTFSKQKEIIDIKNQFKQYKSGQNDIDKYNIKSIDSDKYLNNDIYKSKEIIGNDELNGGKFLKKFLDTENESIEISGTQEKDNNNNNESNIKYFSIGKKDLSK